MFTHKRIPTARLKEKPASPQSPPPTAHRSQYYLSAGLGGTSEGKQLFLEQPASYAYLGREHRKVPGLNDATMYRSVTACMTACGIDGPTQKSIWRALAVVLNLGNVELTSDAEQEAADAADAKERQKMAEETAASGGVADTMPLTPDVGPGNKSALNPQASRLTEDSDSAKAISAVTTLLGVTKEQLAAALTHRTISVGGQSTATILTAAQGRSARDSLAKRIYELLFAHVVSAFIRHQERWPAH